MATIKPDLMYPAVTELEGYAELEGTEWGETAVAMTRLWQMRTLISDKLQLALEKEILAWVKDVKKNATITEREETYKRTIRDLEWN